jgi:hypothetical protein
MHHVPVPTVTDLVQDAVARNPDGSRFLPQLLACFPEAHWGAVRQPGLLRAPADGSLARDVAPSAAFEAWARVHADELTPGAAPTEDPVHLACCLETDTFVLAIEDATSAPLPTGTPAYPARHRVAQVIEAVRAMAHGRLFAVGIVARPGYEEPRRAAILEGLPHIEREEAEDLYAACWGWCTIEQLTDALDAR